MKTRITFQQINNELPQTQCGSCGYDGCEPYAKALAEESTSPNRCEPGGMFVMENLAKLLSVDVSATPLLHPEKIPEIVAIQADKCIGCSMCIKACPVDAIVGAPKREHVIISDECTGCRLCIAPCPTDCITIIPMSKKPLLVSEFQRKASFNKMRYDAKSERSLSLRRSKIDKKSNNQKLVAGDVSTKTSLQQKLASRLSPAQLAKIEAARAKAKARLLK
jgi:electron transport complex protein RnfB